MPRITLALAIVGVLMASTPGHSDPYPPATGADAHRYLSEYADLGLHRTGTAGNQTTADWLAGRFASIGLATSTETFTFSRYLPRAASLSVGSFSPEVFPLYYSGRTGASGITAPLVHVGLGTPIDFALHDVAGKIVLIDVPMPLPGLIPTLSNAITSATTGGAVGVVASIAAPENTISVPDVDSRSGLCGLPTLLTGKIDGEELGLHDGEVATLVLDADYGDAVAPNILGVLPGSSDDILVIGTPITGWFTAATERGAGIGAMLTLARYFAERAASRPLSQTLLFLGTSGHEVGFLGLEEFVRAHPDLIGRISSYLHLGAGVGAKKYLEVGSQIIELPTPDEQRFLTVSENPLLIGLAWSAAVLNGVLPVLPAPQGIGASGEELAMYLAGAPVAALKSTFLWIHTPRDLPDTSSPELIDPVVRMYRDIASNLLAQNPSTVRQANAVASLLATTVPPLPLSIGVISCSSPQEAP